MENLAIYHPARFYLSRTFIVYTTCLLLMAVSYVLQELGFDPNTAVYESVVFLAYSCFMVGVVLKLLTMGDVKPLYGKLYGEIVFTREYIQVHGEVIPVESIQKVAFKGVDFVGLDENYKKWSLENGLSNGTKNWLIIYSQHAAPRKVRFQLPLACGLVYFEEALLTYYVKGKISYLQMVDCLCLRTPEEWNNLKRMKGEASTNNP